VTDHCTEQIVTLWRYLLRDLRAILFEGK